MKKIIYFLSVFFMTVFAGAQDTNFDQLDFLMGKWEGNGSGFGNGTSSIESEFEPVMDGKYIEVKNNSFLVPAEKNSKGEHHVDWGIIRYDKSRETLIYKQFNIEGHVSQYVLNDSLSDNSTLVFETENIENNLKGGRARLTIKRLNSNEIQTVFDVSYRGNDYTCFSTNHLKRKKNLN